MYKNLRNILVASGFIAIIIITFIIFLINNSTYNKFKENYTDTKVSQIEYYIDNNFEDLINLIYAHAIWDEALVALENRDSEWLYYNATGYIVDDGVFNVDFLSFSNEEGNYFNSYGELENLDVLSLKSYNKALFSNEKSFELIYYDDKPLLIASSPFFDNNYENPTGIYLVGRFIEEEEIEELKKIFSLNEVNYIDISDGKKESPKLDHNEMYFSREIFPNSSIYLNASFKIKYLDYIFIGQRNLILIVMSVIAISVISFMSYKIKNVSSKLSEIIRVITDISDGNYFIKLKEIDSKLFPEIDVLIKSINKMSNVVEMHLETIERNVDKLDDGYLELIEILVETVEMNDSYTYHHSISVSEYAVILGNLIGFEDMYNLELAAKLHDVGKISIPNEILSKPGKLTKDEYDIIKTHSKKGYNLLSKVDKFDVAKYGVLYHHEYYDGKGYPYGLKSEEIPMMAQIISVADMYDALTSERAYRKAMPCRDAMEILLSEKGKMLNPKLVDIFYEEMKRLKCHD